MTGTATIATTERGGVLLVPNSALRFTPAGDGSGRRSAPPPAPAAAWCPS
jgi:HlyD family secretion protein